MISHKHKVVFVHIPKCGGQSIERLFLKDLSLSWEDRDALNLRPNPNRHLGPPRLAHLTLSEYVDLHYLSEELLQEYYVFTVVRNPYRRVVSFYKYLGFRCSVPFRDFVVDILPEIAKSKKFGWFVKPQCDFLFSGDKMGNLNEIFHLERVKEMELRLSERFGDRFSHLPHTNQSGNHSRATCVKHRIRHALLGIGKWQLLIDDKVEFTEEIRDAIFSLYESDFRQFGYSCSVPG